MTSETRRFISFDEIIDIQYKCKCGTKLRYSPRASRENLENAGVFGVSLVEFPPETSIPPDVEAILDDPNKPRSLVRVTDLRQKVKALGLE